MKEKLEQIKENLKNSTVKDLFTPDFMKEHTSFSTFEELIDQSGFKVASAEDVKSVLSGELDKYISSYTKFSTWQEMLGAATKEYIFKIFQPEQNT